MSDDKMMNTTVVGQYLADEFKQEPSFRFKKKNSGIFVKDKEEVEVFQDRKKNPGGKKETKER